MFRDQRDNALSSHVKLSTTCWLIKVDSFALNVALTAVMASIRAWLNHRSRASDLDVLNFNNVAVAALVKPFSWFLLLKARWHVPFKHDLHNVKCGRIAQRRRDARIASRSGDAYKACIHSEVGCDRSHYLCFSRNKAYSSSSRSREPYADFVSPVQGTISERLRTDLDIGEDNRDHRLVQFLVVWRSCSVRLTDICVAQAGQSM